MMQMPADARVAAAMMCVPEDCYAVVCGYNSDNMADPFKAQTPLYFSLFGRDLSPGDEATACVRLAVLSDATDTDAALAAYEEFAG